MAMLSFGDIGEASMRRGACFLQANSMLWKGASSNHFEIICLPEQKIALRDGMPDVRSSGGYPEITVTLGIDCTNTKASIRIFEVR